MRPVCDQCTGNLPPGQTKPTLMTGANREAKQISVLSTSIYRGALKAPAACPPHLSSTSSILW